MLIKAGQLDKTFASAEFMQLFWNIWYDSVWGFLDEGYAMKEAGLFESGKFKFALCFWKFDRLDSLWCGT